MRIRLVKEIDGDHTFWKVQHLTFFSGWAVFSAVDAVTCDETKARALFNKVRLGNKISCIEIVEEAVI